METLWQTVTVGLAVALAVGLRFTPLRGYQFTAWIGAVVVLGMIHPQVLDLPRTLHLADTTLKDKWAMLIMIQLVMFGMGTQMKLHDFVAVAKQPQAVLIGVAGQFTIMPLVGWGLTKLFHFENPEIAAGIILIGSCSAGLASNVMAFIAKANLALSIAMTSVTTVLAPVMTPLWMKLLAGELVEVKPFHMMMEIIKMVIVPIGAALLHDYLTRAGRCGRRVVYGLAVGSGIWLLFLVGGGWDGMKGAVSADVLPWIGAAGFGLGAVVVGLAYHGAVKAWPKLEKIMPALAMFGIVYVTLVTTAAGRDNLLQVGGALFAAAALHNTFGYVLAYGLGKACRMDEASCRTVAFEVGLQNGGMASGIASALGKLGTMGLAAAIFIPWMNISGSILANYWAKRPGRASRPDDGATPQK
jgi:BASS family bile acid:Na+ symporter